MKKENSKKVSSIDKLSYKIAEKIVNRKFKNKYESKEKNKKSITDDLIALSSLFEKQKQFIKE